MEFSDAPPSSQHMTKDCRHKRYGAQRHDHRLRLSTHKCSIADTAHLPFAQPACNGRLSLKLHAPLTHGRQYH